MVLRLQLENGKTKEYRTYWTAISTEPRIKSTYQTKCGLSSENNPETMACDHLNCALYASKMEVKHPSVILLACSGIMFFVALYETKNLFESILKIMPFLLFCGIFLIPLSILQFKIWLELNEFKKHGTLHGKRADIV